MVHVDYTMEAKFNVHDADFEDALTVLRRITEPGGAVSIVKLLAEKSDMLGYVCIRWWHFRFWVAPVMSVLGQG